MGYGSSIQKKKCKCSFCGSDINRPAGQTNRTINRGGSVYCSRKCHAAGASANLIGIKFGLLTVVKKDGYGLLGGHSRTMWLCECECGNKKRIFSVYLIKGYSKSCGCHIEHKGVSKISGYSSWKSIKTRCYNSNNHKYPDYGGRGIKMCDRWFNSFKYFMEDMGEKPSNLHTIERINNDGNYEKSNCKWALPIEQSRNKRNSRWITYKGASHIMAEWARIFKVNGSTLQERLDKGQSFESVYKFYQNKNGI